MGLILRYFDFHPHNSKSRFPTTCTFRYVESHISFAITHSLLLSAPIFQVRKNWSLFCIIFFLLVLKIHLILRVLEKIQNVNWHSVEIFQLLFLELVGRISAKKHYHTTHQTRVNNTSDRSCNISTSECQITSWICSENSKILWYYEQSWWICFESSKIKFYVFWSYLPPCIRIDVKLSVSIIPYEFLCHIRNCASSGENKHPLKLTRRFPAISTS